MLASLLKGLGLVTAWVAFADEVTELDVGKAVLRGGREGFAVVDVAMAVEFDVDNDVGGEV